MSLNKKSNLLKKPLIDKIKKKHSALFIVNIIKIVIIIINYIKEYFKIDLVSVGGRPMLIMSETATIIS